MQVNVNTLLKALNSISSGVYILDPELKCIFVNQAYQDITGLRLEDVLHKTPYQILDEGLASNSVALESFKNMSTISLVQRFITGKTALVTGVPIISSDDTFEGIVLTINDMTRQNHLYENLIKNNPITAQSKIGRIKTTRETIIKESNAMKSVVTSSLNAALSDATVLISGETGVGKELIAAIIHENSYYANYPFVKINCAAVPHELAESEFFGYVDGAFTGAKRGGNAGIFELANNGSVLLDEIGELPLPIQSKLLRTLQEKEIRRIGSSKSIKLNFRVIAATNQDLKALVINGTFREDLYYRLNVINITVPPLRERPLDIEPLLLLKLSEFCIKYETTKSFSSDAIEFLKSYSWPGNVRELENTVARLYFTCPVDIITYSDIVSFTDLLSKHERQQNIPPDLNEKQSLKESINQSTLKNKILHHEINYIKEALASTKTMKEAAVLLGIDPSTLSRKCQQYNLTINFHN